MLIAISYTQLHFDKTKKWNEGKKGIEYLRPILDVWLYSNHNQKLLHVVFFF